MGVAGSVTDTIPCGGYGGMERVSIGVIGSFAGSRRWRFKEFMLLFANDEDRAWGMADHLLGDAAEEDVAQACASVGGEDEEIDVFLAGQADDFGHDLAGGDPVGAPGGLPNLIPGELVELPDGGFVHLRLDTGEVDHTVFAIGKGWGDDVEQEEFGLKLAGESEGVVQGFA